MKKILTVAAAIILAGCLNTTNRNPLHRVELGITQVDSSSTAALKSCERCEQLEEELEELRKFYDPKPEPSDGEYYK